MHQTCKLSWNNYIIYLDFPFNVSISFYNIYIKVIFLVKLHVTAGYKKIILGFIYVHVLTHTQIYTKYDFGLWYNSIYTDIYIYK